MDYFSQLDYYAPVRRVSKKRVSKGHQKKNCHKIKSYSGCYNRYKSKSPCHWNTKKGCISGKKLHKKRSTKRRSRKPMRYM